jgi:hypothetical protein
LTSARIIVVTLLLAACSRGIADVPPGVFFPTVPIGDAYPAAQFRGVLEVTEGCLFMTDGSERWLALWPEGYRVERTDGSIEIRDRSGTVIATEGERLLLGGGESRGIEVGGTGAADAWARDLTGQTIPERCGHLYGIVSP